MPQGSCLSPCIFNFYVSDIPNLAQLTGAYADDTHLAESSGDVDEIDFRLSVAAFGVHEWCKAKGLRVSPAKSEVTLFSTYGRDSNHIPQVHLDGNLVPKSKEPKMLGVVCDTQLTGHAQVKKISNDLDGTQKMLNALAGTDWGCSKESLIMTTKALVISKITYGCQIWYPNLADCHIRKLQACQNRALRKATCCHAIASTDHLSAECGILPVKEKLDMLCHQFVAAAYSPNHPSHSLLPTGPPPRLQKHTVFTKFEESILPFVIDDQIEDHRQSYVRNRLHTRAVRDYLRTAPPNRILNSRPPPINEEELSLSIRDRAILSQLRSGHCRQLLDYQNVSTSSIMTPALPVT